MRTAQIDRKTKETDISLFLDLDGKGKSEISSGVGFLDHMLELFAKHGRFDLKLSCKGDLNVDGHHTVEDTGICLGEAFVKALGGKEGIRRYGDCVLPMDEWTFPAELSFRTRQGYAPGRSATSIRSLPRSSGPRLQEQQG